jgi:hypothetical protein
MCHGGGGRDASLAVYERQWKPETHSGICPSKVVSVFVVDNVPITSQYTSHGFNPVGYVVIAVVVA